MAIRPTKSNSIHDFNNRGYREIGVGGVLGEKAQIAPYQGSAGGYGLDVGPQVVTQVSAQARTNRSFIPGVAYYDLNGMLAFSERLLFSGGGQFCLAQISTNDGRSWETVSVYSRNATCQTGIVNAAPLAYTGSRCSHQRRTRSQPSRRRRTTPSGWRRSGRITSSIPNPRNPSMNSSA